jgi:deoxyribose-phosphate aldolase
MSFYGLVDGTEKSLITFLDQLSGVDQVGADARAAMLATRSIKTSSKKWAIETAISMVDLTTLEGADTPGKVRALCSKAVRPDPTDPTVPSVGAVCVYNDMVEVARTHLDSIGGEHVPVAAVSTAFPSGRASMEVKIQDAQDAINVFALMLFVQLRVAPHFMLCQGALIDLLVQEYALSPQANHRKAQHGAQLREVSASALTRRSHTQGGLMDLAAAIWAFATNHSRF